MYSVMRTATAISCELPSTTSKKSTGAQESLVRPVTNRLELASGGCSKTGWFFTVNILWQVQSEKKLGPSFSNRVPPICRETKLNEGQSWTKNKTLKGSQNGGTLLASYLLIVVCEISLVWWSGLDNFQRPVLQRNIFRIHWFPFQILQILLHFPPALSV